MMLAIIKFFHILCGISFFGITMAAFFYITHSLRQHDRALIDYSIRASYFGDAIILPCVVLQFITAAFLVSHGNFSLSVPWIFIAYHAFGLLAMLWLFTVIIKKYYFSKNSIPAYAIKSFYVINIAMIVIFIIIIHDAVMKSTALSFLFK